MGNVTKKSSVSAQATSPNDQVVAETETETETDELDATFPITIKTLSGKTTTIHVASNYTILKVKKNFQKATGSEPPNRQRLIFKAKELENTGTIEGYEITEGATLHLIFVLLRKPVIYIHATEPTDVEVSLKLDPSWSFSATYPVVHRKDPDGNNRKVCWNVVANPTGILFDKASGLEVSYLYWEAEPTPSPNQISTPSNSRPGSPTMEDSLTSKTAISLDITQANSILLPIAKVPQYLDTTLLALGLHTEARTAFITFWLPDILKYHHIALRFLPQVEYDTLAHLSVSPSPSSISRVFMLWKGVSDILVDDWTEARERGASRLVSEWRDIIGLASSNQVVEHGLKVLEWGGMEVV